MLSNNWQQLRHFDGIRLTQCNDDRDDHTSPERNIPEQDHDLIVKVTAFKEGIDHDPEQHDNRRPDNDEPCEEGPA